MIWKFGKQVHLQKKIQDGQYISGLAKFEFEKPNDLGTVYGL
jgi:hypothetical protein